MGCGEHNEMSRETLHGRPAQMREFSLLVWVEKVGEH